MGFTNGIPTIGCLVAFGITAWMLARIIFLGIRLTTLIPLLAAIIPIATIFVGALIYGDNASPARLGLLTVACVLVGISGRI